MSKSDTIYRDYHLEISEHLNSGIGEDLVLAHGASLDDLPALMAEETMQWLEARDDELGEAVRGLSEDERVDLWVAIRELARDVRAAPVSETTLRELQGMWEAMVRDGSSTGEAAQVMWRHILGLVEDIPAEGDCRVPEWWWGDWTDTWAHDVNLPHYRGREWWACWLAQHVPGLEDIWYEYLCRDERVDIPGVTIDGAPAFDPDTLPGINND